MRKAVTPYAVHRSMAAHRLCDAADLRHIQAILGQARITSTELSTHVSLEDLKEVVREVLPHGRKNR